MSGTTRTEDEYAALYQEHNARLVAYARSLTGNQAVAEDLAAEAHFRVWRRLSEGHAVDNPSAYLTTTVRNLAAGLGRAQREIARDLDEIPQDAERSETVAADPEQRASHVDLISRLLKELPERWAKALWYAEVEDLPMEAVGERIGASAGTTAVVLTRARERLRQAFLQSQAGAPADEACGPYWKQMPTIVRATASARRTRTVLEHCDECADCRARMLVLTEANTRLPVLLGPALLGIMLGGGAWFLPAVAGVGAAAGAGAGAGTVGGTGTSGTAGAAARTGSKARHAHISARAHVLKHGLSPAKTAVYGSVAAVGVAAVVAAVALGSTTSPSHTPTASARLTAQPTVAAGQSAASAEAGSAAGTPTTAATQAAGLATPASDAATTAPGTTSPAAALAQGSPQENQAAAADPTTSSAATTPIPASTTPSAAASPTVATTGVIDSPSASASSAAPTPSPTTGSPTPNPTPTPTLTPTLTPPSSPTPPSCTFYIVWICVIG